MEKSSIRQNTTW